VCAQSAKQGATYTKGWIGEVCQNQSNEGSPWDGIKCADGRVTFVHLKGGASGSLDGFGQLTALSELHLDNNYFTGKQLNAASTHTCGWVAARCLLLVMSRVSLARRAAHSALWSS